VFGSIAQRQTDQASDRESVQMREMIKATAQSCFSASKTTNNKRHHAN
jgi:hypothetical protein